MAPIKSRRLVGNLPVDVTSFVGRRRELSEAKRLLAATSLLTLTGSGGVGKTRLARRLAATVERAFPDGVWHVELASLAEGELLARTVSDVLGVRDQSARPALQSLLDYVADKRLMLVLDNCEHLVDACAVLIDALLRMAPGLRILVTSRQVLRVAGEQMLAVPPLSVPEEDVASVDAVARCDATVLFADRASDIEPGFVVTAENYGLVARLCRRLDGIPLAIELAAVWLRALSVQEILDRLDDRFRLLTRGSRAALPRHQTLRATIDWSYQLCSERERVLWARLSVFAGGCDIEAVEAVCTGEGIGSEDVLALLAGLVDKSIVLPQEHGGVRMRYRMLETVRQYGKEHLVSSGEQATIRGRHRDYFRGLTARANVEWFSPSQLDWYTRLQLERPNMQVALDFCLATPGGVPVAMEMLVQPWTYWLVSGSLGEARHWLDRTIAVAQEPNGALANALAWNAWWALLQGDSAAALAMLDESRAIGERLGDAAALARVSSVPGRATLFQGDHEHAVVLLQEALAYYRAHDHLEDTWLCIYQLSQAEALLGDADRVSRFGEQCMEIAKAHGAQAHLSYGMWVAALGAWIRGDLRRTHALILDALEIKRPFNDLFGTAVCFEVLAWATAAEGASERASRLLGAAADALAAQWNLDCPTSGTLPAPSRNASSGCVRRWVRRRSRPRSTMGSALPWHRRSTTRWDTSPSSSSAMPQPTTEAGLTRRQVEVARLVAEGMSNKEIGARLVISQRTAEAHVENILTKLGFDRRAQIATWIHDQTETD